MELSTIARNAAGDAIVSLLDEGSAAVNGYIEIRSGTKPASPQTAATGTLLSTLQLANPAFPAFANGSAAANTIADDSNIAASGAASWFRMYDRDGTAVMDGDVTITGGGGDIEFDNINFIQGGTVSISTLTATMPQ